MRPRFWSDIPNSLKSVFMIKITSVFALISFFVLVLLIFQPSQHHDSIMLRHVKSAAERAMLNIMVAEERLSTPAVANPLINKTSSAAKRIALFKQKLPELQIFESTKNTSGFNHRIQEFFGDVHSHENTTRSCMVRFFMTWISPLSKFGRRELLSLETLFKANPKGCVVILSTTMDSPQGQIILEPLVARGFHVLPIAPDLGLLFSNTPAQTWLDDLKIGKIDPGKIPIEQNLSNLLRLVIVYKYGGVYLDADFIILKDVSKLRNSIGAQSIDEGTKRWTRLNNAMLSFDKGHPLLLKFIEEFASHFNGNRWGYNGPYLVSRVVERVVNDSRFEFTVLPPVAFYPVDWIKISEFFRRPNSTALAMWSSNKLIKISRETYGVHLWNKESRSLRIEEGSIIGRLISKHCIICQDIYDS